MTFPFIPIISLLDACSDGEIGTNTYALISWGSCNAMPPGGCATQIVFDVRWNDTVCDDDCHHFELWRRVAAGSVCGGSYSSVMDDQNCGLAGNGCSKSGYNSCYRDSPSYARDTGEVNRQTYSFCWRIDIRRDSDDSLDDQVVDLKATIPDTIWCDICGTT
jgi:hypothetical protein